VQPTIGTWRASSNQHSNTSNKVFGEINNTSTEVYNDLSRCLTENDVKKAGMEEESDVVYLLRTKQETLALG
jgi:hypothetical protein